MTVEELMKPRYKVISRYPDSPLGIGIIINGKTFNSAEGTKFYCEDYPAIFKKLEWWEDREQNDLPQYVKLKSSKHGRVAVLTEIRDETSEWCVYLDDEAIPYSCHAILPATKEEYENQINERK